MSGKSLRQLKNVRDSCWVTTGLGVCTEATIKDSSPEKKFGFAVEKLQSQNISNVNDDLFTFHLDKYTSEN